MFINQLIKLIYYSFIVFWFAFVLSITAWQTYCFACLTLAETMFCYHVFSQAALFIRR